MGVEYKPPFIFQHAHVSTVYPALFRKVDAPPYFRERISTPDNDFLDLDWLARGSDRIVVISHGLEGNASRAYVRGMAKVFHENGFDILAWNYRGCGGEINKTTRFYHSGATDDLDHVVRHALSKGYRQLFLVGFSLGGNLTLKFLGEQGDQVSSQVKGAVAFSTPFDLHRGCLKLSSPTNWIYSQRFLRSLKEKVTRKARLLGGIDIRGIDKIRNLKEFDDQFTAPLHGFRDAVDYYEKCSAIKFVKGIAVPTLAVNAANDPFLSPECYPAPNEIANDMLTLEYPSHGGHVGFAIFNQNGVYWSELRAYKFIQSLL